MYKKPKQDKKYIVLIILIIAAILIVYFSYIIKTERQLNIVESVIKDSLIITENIITSPFKYVANKIDELSNYSSVYKENKELKNNINKYKLLEVENTNLRNEITSLKNLNKITFSSALYTPLNASVIKRNIGYWYNELTLDKGSKNGIKEGMGVITNDGLIGTIVKTSLLNSSVRLITDSKMSVSINVNDKITNGVITSYDLKGNNLIVEGISDYIDIPIGSYVYTTGFNNQIPSGILIGTVSDIDTDEYELSKIIKVKLSADINNLNYVVILKRDDQL